MTDAPRIGLGIDVHRLESGRRCVVGGVELDCEVGPTGHSDGDAVIVRDGDRPFDAESGQLVLDFSVGELHRQVVELMAPSRATDPGEKRGAFDWYREGCRLEADSDTLAEG